MAITAKMVKELRERTGSGMMDCKNVLKETNGDIEKAIDNARALELQYANDDKSMFTSIKEMNPYTSVYKLIEQFMAEIS